MKSHYKRLLGHVIALVRSLPEPIFVAAFCILPLLIAAASYYLTAYYDHLANPKLAQLTIASSLWRTVSKGELYLYCFSLFGTLLWLCGVDKPRRRLPVRWLFLLIVSGIGLLCIGFYAMRPPLDREIPNWLVHTSMIFYAVYLVIYTILLRILNNPGNLEDGFNLGAESLMRELGKEAGQ